MREDAHPASVLASACAPLLSPLAASIPSGAFFSSSFFSSPSQALPHSPVRMSVFAWFGAFYRGGWSCQARVKAGAAPGRGGAEGGGAARRPSPREPLRPPALRRRSPRGPHPRPESLPWRSPGALASRRKCWVTPPLPAPCDEPAPRAAGLGSRGAPCGTSRLGETGAPLEVKPLGCKTCAGRSPGEPRDSPLPHPPPHAQLLRFSPGLAHDDWRTRARGLQGSGRPLPRWPVGARGRCCTPRPHLLCLDGSTG